MSSLLEEEPVVLLGQPHRQFGGLVLGQILLVPSSSLLLALVWIVDELVLLDVAYLGQDSSPVTLSKPCRVQPHLRAIHVHLALGALDLVPLYVVITFEVRVSNRANRDYLGGRPGVHAGVLYLVTRHDAPTPLVR